MAKTIKFNLICDEKPIRTIEDLQENFSIEDILKYYKNGLLLRWLKVRGYNAEYRLVSSVEKKEDIDIIKELIRIFDVEADEKKIEEGVYILQFCEERQRYYEKYKEKQYKESMIINHYKERYKYLIKELINNSADIAKIKADITELMNNYRWAMNLSHREIFIKLCVKENFLAIMCLLMNEEARRYYLPIKIENDEGKTIIDTDINPDKKAMCSKIWQILRKTSFKEKLGENLRSFAGNTDGYWKDLESKGKKYMIIDMKYGNYVRSAGVQGGDLSSDDIENKFVILNGIDYKSNSSREELRYMEV